MEESSQSNPYYDLVRRELDAAYSRDRNLHRTIIICEFNNICNSFTNLSVLIDTIDPLKGDAFSLEASFILADIKRLIDTSLGDDREESLDPGMEEK